jgi:hypothetical protein
MEDYKAIMLIKSILKERSKWIIEVNHPKDDFFKTLEQKAKKIAERRLCSISLFSLWQGYKKWKKGDPIVKNADEYFHTFISDTTYQFVMSKLKNTEQKLFEDFFCLTFKFN